ncbi:MAG: hypothetical protein ACRDHF_00585 [Tepidiformaceae bacterium]
MAVRKLAISLEPELAEDIAEAASRERVSVSKWLSEAARAQIRHQAALDAVKAYEDEFGAFTDEQLERARRSWQEA